MASENIPKAILFDVGGVLVLSPFQAIVDYENKHKIPKDWINYAISRGAPNGHWQRLERGEIKLDAAFFTGFNEDLRNPELWRLYHESFRSGKKKLKDMANPTQLGDPVSLKAETANSTPTGDDRGAQSSSQRELKPTESSRDSEKPSLSKLAKDSTIGDPTSLSAEEVVIPPQSNTRTPSPPPSHTGPDVSNSDPSTSLPPIPTIDAESLFWSMMSAARTPDPYISPALHTLSKHHKPTFILGALTNTIIFPPPHPYSQPHPIDPKPHFDIYISSSHVGLRKPDPAIYKLAISELDRFDRERGGEGVGAADVVFLDDIGENLRVAREVGMRTVKVMMGKTWRAVKELEGIVRVELMDEKTRRAKL